MFAGRCARSDELIHIVANTTSTAFSELSIAPVENWVVASFPISPLVHPIFGRFSFQTRPSITTDAQVGHRERQRNQSEFELNQQKWGTTKRKAISRTDELSRFASSLSAVDEPRCSLRRARTKNSGGIMTEMEFSPLLSLPPEVSPQIVVHPVQTLTQSNSCYTKYSLSPTRSKSPPFLPRAPSRPPSSTAIPRSSRSCFSACSIRRTN